MTVAGHILNPVIFLDSIYKSKTGKITYYIIQDFCKQRRCQFDGIIPHQLFDFRGQDQVLIFVRCYFFHK